VADEFATIMSEVALWLLGEPNPKLSNDAVWRYGTRGSLAVNVRSGTWFDHESNEGGGVIMLVMRVKEVDRAAAVELMRSHDPHWLNGGSNTGFVIGSEYSYLDETGKLLFQVCRLVPKDFRQRRPNGVDWIWDLKGVRRVPYRLPHVIEAVALKRPVLVVEGEKDADNLARLGYMGATCNPGGANKWRSAYNEHFRGADVVLLPDNDEAGWKHVNTVGAALTGVASGIRVLIMPDGKKDVSDWIEAGGTREQLDALIDSAPPFWVQPSAQPQDDAGKEKAQSEEDALLDALADLPNGVEFARRRKRLAKALGVPQDAVDAEVEARRLDREIKANAPLFGHWEIEPWPETADGDALLRDIIARIRRHVVISHDGALTIALWIMLAWVHDEVARHSPILTLSSAEPECGKSETIGVISYLIPRCIATVDISKAAIYRSIERWRPSFCIDEFDTVLAGASTDDNKAELRSIINGGHTRDTCIIRCLGEDNIPQKFDTFCPKVIGMVGRKMPTATLSRCVFVEMRKRKSTEPFEQFRHEDDPDLAQLRSRLLRWSVDNAVTLGGAEPAMPDGFINRRADNWRLQFAIADLAGSDWGERARDAAAKIEAVVDKRSIGIQLLSDVRRLFRDRGDPDGMLTTTILAELAADAEAPWSEYRRGKPMTPRQLAGLLGNYGVHSEDIHLRDGVHGKGYKRIWLEEVWGRWLLSEASPPP
jgi:Protein of unknown function (DUF3631)